MKININITVNLTDEEANAVTDYAKNTGHWIGTLSDRQLIKKMLCSLITEKIAQITRETGA